jgi:hypothetical protein
MHTPTPLDAKKETPHTLKGVGKGKGRRFAGRDFREVLEAMAKRDVEVEARNAAAPKKPCLDCGHLMLDYLTTCPKCHSSQWGREHERCESCGLSEKTNRHKWCG